MLKFTKQNEELRTLANRLNGIELSNMVQDKAIVRAFRETL